jgi:ABC-type sugar transport system substrate-binding protein
MSILLTGALLAIAGCNRESGGGPGEPGRIKIGYVLHGLNDFTQVIKKGAEDAGRDLGVEVEVAGPAGFVSTEAIGMFQAMVQKRKAGVVVVPQPGDVWVRPIREAVAAGVPVVTANVTSPGSAAAAWFGQDERQSGVLLARALRQALESEGKLEGKIVVGICLLGVDVLIARYDGFREGMAGTRYALTEPLDVSVENTRNYGAWESLAGAHPDMVAAVGLCSLDIPNLARLKARSGAKWLIAGYDLNLDTLEAVRAGVAQATVGQHPYLQGYLPVRALVEHLRDGKPLAQGWVDVGTEVVTRENIAAVQEREASEAAETSWYARHMAEAFKDLGTQARPLPGSSR